jgi:DNA-binding IscR family transcriptional regulator
MVTSHWGGGGGWLVNSPAASIELWVILNTLSTDCLANWELNRLFKSCATYQLN